MPKSSREVRNERPWWREDNRVDFEAEGYRCAMRRGPMGAWCGYVGIPSTHPWFGKAYSDNIKPTADMLGPRDPLDHGMIDVLCMSLSDKGPEEELSITLAMRIHGGLTYASDQAPYNEPDGLWWFGFDCSHLGDLIPDMIQYTDFNRDHEVYRDQAYVVAECQSLAAQLAKVARDA